MDKMFMYNRLQQNGVKPNFLSTPKLEKFQKKAAVAVSLLGCGSYAEFRVYSRTPDSLLLSSKREILELLAFIPVSPGFYIAKSSG